MKDLALLVADKNMDFAMRGILGRPESLGIRGVSYEIRQHVGRDGGVRVSGPETLAAFRSEFNFGIVMLDWEGSGSDVGNAIALEEELDHRLSTIWGDAAKTIVIEPELDAWAWGSDNAMSDVLGWGRDQKIREWLDKRDYRFNEDRKPARPKEALAELMVELSKPRSSIIYQRLMEKISLARCVDPAFNRLKTTLRTWFPAVASAPSE